MLSNKKAIMEIHGLTTQYSQNLSLSRAFFGRLNGIQTAQNKIAKKISKAKNTTKIMTILEEKTVVEGKTITNSDLLQRDGSYLGLRLLYGLFYILTFPFSLPILLFWSRITRGTINFIKTDGSILVEQIQERCQSVSNISAQYGYAQLLEHLRVDSTKWINDMFNSNGNPSHPGKGTTRVGEQVHLNLYSHFRTDIASSLMWYRRNVASCTDMTRGALMSTNNMLSSFTSGFYSTRKLTVGSKSPLDDAILNCETQDQNHIDDLTIITDAITKFEQEQTYLNKKMQAEQEPIEQADVNGSSFRQVDGRDLDEPMAKRECNEMLRHYHELMDFYPTYLEGDRPTLDGVRSYHAASEAHHEKILTIAERLVPELSSLLKQGRLNASMNVASNKLM